MTALTHAPRIIDLDPPPCAARFEDTITFIATSVADAYGPVQAETFIERAHEQPTIEALLTLFESTTLLLDLAWAGRQ